MIRSFFRGFTITGGFIILTSLIMIAVGCVIYLVYITFKDYPIATGILGIFLLVCCMGGLINIVRERS